MEDSFCYLGSFNNKDEAKAYYLSVRGKIEGLHRLIQDTFPDANPQKEFVSQRTQQDTSGLYAPVKVYYDDINYSLGYDLATYSPNGCVSQEDVFWNKYYEWLKENYSQTKIQDQVRNNEMEAGEAARKSAELARVKKAAKEIFKMYKIIPKIGGITSSEFQSHLEKMIVKIQELNRFPELSLDDMRMYEEDIKVSNVAMTSIVDFINKNRLQPVGYDATPEGMKIAARNKKAKLGKFSKNGVSQTFLIANFGGNVQHMPLVNNEESAPTLNEIVPGVFVFGEYEQAYDTEQPSTDF